ncbi:MAG TPA: hypothetical protein VHO48_07670 [Anaerolineaceae bacterium]|nr:hypothetical protein [Anaerolineaceae bacterium]
MPTTSSVSQTVDLLDIAPLDYAGRLTAAALQGLANRQGPRVFLDYGIYDDPSARRTNEVFIDDELWYGKFRAALGYQDRENARVYTEEYGYRFEVLPDLDALARKYRDLLHGVVIWDPDQPDTVNAALMRAAQDGCLVIHPDQLRWATHDLGLPIVEDLRGRWKDRLELYRWCFAEFFERSQPGQIACIEPDWQRPEFVDYLVQNRIFTYSLSAKGPGKRFSLGQTLLLMLVAGPARLREALFDLRLDGVVRSIGLALMGWGCPETRLGNRLQCAVKPQPYPTIFGWHTRRDDEFAFMVQLSANGLRLVPCHLAANFSFHSQVPCETPFPPDAHESAEVALEKDKTYLTITLSDGDQLMMMSTGELGSWRMPERGQVAFNWEIQPLLVELAPALLKHYVATRTPNDYLIPGPSGAGYVIPSLVPHLERYLAETARVCGKAGVHVLTEYIADPPQRVIRQYGQMPGEWIGFLAGYAHFGRLPFQPTGGRFFAANDWPPVDQIPASCDQVFEGVRRLIDAPGPRPRFIGVHLFAYRTTIADVAAFAQTLNPACVEIVRADRFLKLCQKAHWDSGR